MKKTAKFIIYPIIFCLIVSSFFVYPIKESISKVFSPTKTKASGSPWNQFHSPTTAALNGIWGANADKVYAVGTAGTVIKFDGSTWEGDGTVPCSILDYDDVSGTGDNDIMISGETPIYDPNHLEQAQEKLTFSTPTLVFTNNKWYWGTSFLGDINSPGFLNYKPATNKSNSPYRSGNLFPLAARSYLIGKESAKEANYYTPIAGYGIEYNPQNQPYIGGPAASGEDNIVFRTTTDNQIYEPMNNEINAFWGNKSRKFWAAGLNEEADGAAFYLWRDNGQDFSGWVINANFRNSVPIRAMWGAADDNIWAVGSGTNLNGTAERDIYHYDGCNWYLYASYSGPSAGDLSQPATSMWGSGANDIWIVGTGRGFMHFDGTSWTNQPPNAYQDTIFHDVWGSAADNVWAVGDGGAILHIGSSGNSAPGNNGDYLCPGAAEALRGVVDTGITLTFSQDRDPQPFSLSTTIASANGDFSAARNTQPVSSQLLTHNDFQTSFWAPHINIVQDGRINQTTTYKAMVCGGKNCQYLIKRAYVGDLPAPPTPNPVLNNCAGAPGAPPSRTVTVEVLWTDVGGQKSVKYSKILQDLQ